MSASADPGQWRCRADAVTPGQTARFDVRAGDRTVNGFVVNHHGQHHAYVNRCPHAGTPLDLWPNEFLSEDGRLLVCATHGAAFEPGTGRCVDGPCLGASLRRIPLTRDGDWLVVSWPA